MTKKTGYIIAFFTTIILDVLGIVMVCLSIMTPLSTSRIPLYIMVIIILTFFSIKCYKSGFKKENN